MTLKISLDHDSGVPISRQISDSIRREILLGNLKPGQALPSVRELSLALDISRSTVLKGFEDLFSQGYISTTSGCGTFVSKQLPGELSQQTDWLEYESLPGKPPSAVKLSSYGDRLKLTERDWSTEHVHQISHGGPPLDLAPLNQWRLLLERHCRLKDLSLLEYKDQPFGYLPLREAYASYLTRARAVACTAQRTAVFFARDLRLDIICRLLLEPGDNVAVENPGYPTPRQKFAAHGANIVGIPIDKNGLDVGYLDRLHQQFKLVYVTPSHQEPTGAVLPVERRRHLLEWASRTGAFIIEDDYDSEYRYGSTPLPSLQGLDDADCVIHLSCLWKVLSPVLRLGFLVLPHCLVRAVSLAKGLAERDLPLIDQFALADFINEGHLERSIRRIRSIYGKRRQALSCALEHYLGQSISIAPESAGTEMLVKFHNRLSDDAIVQCAGQSGLTLLSSRPYYIDEGRPGEFVLPFAHLPEEALRQGARKLASLLASMQ